MSNIATSPNVRFRLYTSLLVVLLAVQSLGGLLIPNLYRDNQWVMSAFRGTDIMTLAVIIPLLIIAQMFIQRGSLRARLTWMGTVFYVFYNNLYYLFSAYNRFFLVYVAIAVLSVSALIAAFIGTDSENVAARVTQKIPRGLISFIMFAQAAILGVLWIGQSVSFIFTGQVPQLIIDTGGSTNFVAILDLTLIVPPLILGAVLLRRRQAWGYVVSAAILVPCALETLSLTLGGPIQAAAGVKGAWTMVPLWVLMGVFFLVALIPLFRNIAPENR